MTIKAHVISYINVTVRKITAKPRSVFEIAIDLKNMKK
jgi:hypothetical protein